MIEVSNGNVVPQVSVGIPVHNAERFLPETLACIQAQEFRQIEIVISDNASSDGTEGLCRAAAAADPRIVYDRSPVNRGMGWNFNRVLELATAPLFVWNASDDLADPAMIGRCVEALEANPDAVLACPRVQLIDENSRIIGALGDADLDFSAPAPSARIAHYLSRQAVHMVYGVTRTDMLRHVGGMPQLRGDDVVLGVELLMRGRFVLVPEQLSRARRHAGQGSLIRDVLAQAAEHDPLRRMPLAFPNWRMNAELYRRIADGPLDRSEQARCMSAVLRSWTLPRWRSFPADVKGNAMALRQRWA